MTEKSFGEFLMELLEFYGVECVFGIPGVHTAELYRGLDGSPIEHITPRHEQGAGFAADGYARVTGKPGVCLIVTGPGLCNTITAMGQAYGDSVPMLVISGVNSQGEDRTGDGHLHELPNQSALAEQVAAFSYTITKPDEILPGMARAFAVFEGGRPRPVHIEIPLDIMNCAVEDLRLPKVRPTFAPPVASPDAVAQMAALARVAKAPIVLAGGGARAANLEIMALAERLNAPVITTINGRGILPSTHPLALNVTASGDHARALIAQADLVLAFGTELGPTDYDILKNGGTKINGTLVRVDIAQDQLNRNFPADLGVCSDTKSAASGLVAALVDHRAPIGLSDQVTLTLAAIKRDEPPLYARANTMIAAIWDEMPDAILVGDSTQPIYAGNDAITIPSTGRWFNSATGFGTLGYGLPAAIGAKRGAPDRPVIAIAGDGGVQFSISELATAKEANIPLTLLIWDNACYGEIRNYMEAADIKPEGVDLYTPNFGMLAKAYGWEVAHVTSMDELRHALKTGYERAQNLVVLGIADIEMEA